MSSATSSLTSPGSLPPRNTLFSIPGIWQTHFQLRIFAPGVSSVWDILPLDHEDLSDPSVRPHLTWLSSQKKLFVEPNFITLFYFFKELVGNFLIYIFVCKSVLLPRTDTSQR